MPTKLKRNLSIGRKYQRNKYRRIDPLPKMDWNTLIIMNKPEESVQFNQEPEPIEKEIDSCFSLFEAMLKNQISFMIINKLIPLIPKPHFWIYFKRICFI